MSRAMTTGDGAEPTSKPSRDPFWLVMASGIIIGAVVTLAVGWALQTLRVQDDLERGEKFATMMQEDAGRPLPELSRGEILQHCEFAAEAIYGDQMFDGTGGASHAQQAFYYGCSDDPVGTFGQ